MDWRRLKILLSEYPCNIIFSFLYKCFVFLSHMIWLIKNGDLSVTSISTSMFGHVSISSLRSNASLYLYNICITFIFSSLLKHELLKLTYFSNISLSVMFLFLSSGSNHGYLSVGVACSLSLSL